MEGLEIVDVKLSRDAAANIMQTALDAGATYGFGYWAEVVEIGYTDPKDERIGFLRLVQHDDGAGKVDTKIAGANNGLRSPKHGNRQVFIVNDESLRRALVKAFNAGHHRYLGDDLDGSAAEEIIQFACFGELVYG